MLRRLQEKFPPASLAQADAALLPFPSNSFDAVLTIHVMHLIGPWREALREFRRVLKPEGKYLDIHTYEPVGNSIRQQTRHFWHSWISAQGMDARTPGVQNRVEFIEALQSMNASVTEVEVLRYTHTFTLREELERYRSRVSSNTWEIPEGLYEASIQELHAKFVRDYGDLDQQVEDEVRFVIDAIRFES
jgi:ubiquinone/menaquinone biosynthesis C-methylase UbiE